MAAKKKPSQEWLLRLKNAYAIHNVVAWRTEFPFFVIRWDGGEQLDWLNLGDPRDRLKPFHFEIFYGKEPMRDTYYLKALAKARKQKTVVLKNLFGFWDLFYKLPGDPKGLAFLHAGQFLREQPRWETLCGSWRSLTGQAPASANPDFVHFVRMALKLPVIEPQMLGAMKSFVKLYGAYLSGDGTNKDLAEKVDAINREHFSELWPINDWVDSVISPDKFLLPPWYYYEGKLTDWIKEGMGISRLPTTVMALMPIDSRADALDPVQTRVRNARIQRECIAFTRDLPDTAATRLQDYGVAIITLSKRGKSSARARLELRERAQKIAAFVTQEFSIRSLVGIGRTMPKGAPLYESYRDAVIALHMCVQLDRSVLFFDEHGGGERFKYGEIQKSGDRLKEALERESTNEVKLASDRLVQLVLRYANERIEVARGQFLATLFQLLASVQRRNPMRDDARSNFANDLSNRLEEATSMNQVIESFNDALSRLSYVSSKVWHGPNVMLLEMTLQYLKENFFEPLSLPEVARKAGFSVPAFTRVFKQATGTSFLAYLRSIRVEHAKKLLTTTGMTTEQIAQVCGFHSQHHLIRSFKKVTNQTPGAFRKANARRQ
jgi:AraC-like DNA-binding protein